MENNKTPSIRFKGFTDPWEQRKAKNLFVSTADKGHPELPVLSATQDRGMIRRDENSINIYHDKKNEEGYKRVLPGQFVIHLRSFQGGFAHSAIEGITSPAYTVFGFSEPEKHNPNYWKYVFTSKEFIRRLETVTYGIRDGRSISYDEFLTMDFVYPTQDEQTEIANYLDTLDRLITLHQRKYNKLLNVKKSMLEKMFPKNGSNIPKIRFKGFTDPWEQRKLGDTNTFFTDGNYGEAYPKASDMTDSSTGIPFLTGGNLKNGRLDLSGANYITYEKHMKLTSGHLAEDDIVIAVRGSLGALGYVNKDNSGWNINSQLAILRTDKTVLIGKYLIQFLLSTTGQKELLSKQTGSALKQLPISSLKDIAIPITSIEEQERIGMYLQNLDNLITLHQRELEKLKYIKKSMLEKMFV